MRALLVLLLVALASAQSNHWYVWTQATDTDGAWGFLNFYPKAITVRPGDYLTFIQNHDAGIIQLTNGTSGPPSQFYTGSQVPCPNNTCVALTQFSLPHVGGPIGNATDELTHVNDLNTFDYSSGFIMSESEAALIPPFIPFHPSSQWTFYFDPSLPVTTAADVQIQAWEVLHVMRMPITITVKAGQPSVSPSEANTTALTQIATDTSASQIAAIFASTVAPVNTPNWNVEACAWTVHLGAQVSSTPTGYGIGSFDRFLPFDTTLKKSIIHINQGDRINFLQITPHGHSVSITSQANFPFPPNLPSVKGDTLTEPTTHFIPSPFPDTDGIIRWDGTGSCIVGPMFFPGQNSTVEFNVAPGEYDYMCVFHEAVNMIGTIIVEDPGTLDYPAARDDSKCASAALTPLAALVLVLLLALVQYFY